jgi:hypothetical protein
MSSNPSARVVNAEEIEQELHRIRVEWNSFGMEVKLLARSRDGCGYDEENWGIEEISRTRRS